MRADALRKLAEAGRFEELAHALAQVFPKGLVGERDALVTFLVNRVGLSHADAVRVADALEAAGHAHHLPGERPRWIFTSKPVSLRALMRMLDEEYAEFVGEGDEDPREEALRFIGSRLGVDREVAEEILEGLAAAGYAEVAYHAESERDRYLFKFPEIFAMTYRV